MARFGTTRISSRALVLLTCTGAWFPDAAPVAAPRDVSLSTTVEQVRVLRVARQGRPVRNRELAVGHLRLFLEEGTLFPLADGAMHRRGFLFEGRGRFLYRSENSADRLLPEEDSEGHDLPEPQLSGEFDRLVLHGVFDLPPGWWPEQPGEPAEDRSPALGDEAFRRLRELWQLGPSDTDQLMTHAVLDGRREAFVWAALRLERRTVRYVYDGVQNFAESLYYHERRQRPAAGQGRLVSLQPVPQPGAKGEPPLVLTRARIDVSTDDNRRGTIRSELTLQVHAAGLRVAAFHLSDERQSLLPDAEPATGRPIDVRSVRDATGTELEFHRGHGVLLVDLGRGQRPGEVVRLSIETVGELFAGLSGRRAHDYFELLTSDWHPRPTGVGACRSTFDLRVRTAKPWVPIVPGRLLERRETATHHELRARSDVATSYSAVIAGRYRTTEDHTGSVPVRVHTYDRRGGKIATDLAARARSMIHYLEQGLGPYPHAALDIVELPERTNLGLAGPGIVLLGSLALRPGLAPAELEVGRDRDLRLAHEIAHQWFGNKAAVSPHAAWLSESIAEYLGGFAARASSGAGTSRGLPPADVVARWRRGALKASRRSISSAHRLAPDGFGETRRALLYDRGPLVLHMLHRIVGTRRFVSILQQLLTRAERGPLDAAAFEQVASATAGVDMSWFVDQWVGRGGIPRIRVEHRVERTASGRYVLDGTLRQSTRSRFKVVYVPLVLEMPDGRRSVTTIVHNRPLTPFRLELGQKPSRVLIDPSKTTLVRYD